MDTYIELCGEQPEQENRIQKLQKIYEDMQKYKVDDKTKEELYQVIQQLNKLDADVKERCQKLNEMKENDKGIYQISDGVGYYSQYLKTMLDMSECKEKKIVLKNSELLEIKLPKQCEILTVINSLVGTINLQDSACRVLDIDNSIINDTVNGKLVIVDVNDSNREKYDVSGITVAKLQFYDCPNLKEVIMNDKVYHFSSANCPLLDMDDFIDETPCEFWGFDVAEQDQEKWGPENNIDDEKLNHIMHLKVHEKIPEQRRKLPTYIIRRNKLIGECRNYNQDLLDLSERQEEMIELYYCDVKRIVLPKQCQKLKLYCSNIEFFDTDLDELYVSGSSIQGFGEKTYIQKMWIANSRSIQKVDLRNVTIGGLSVFNCPNLTEILLNKEKVCLFHVLDCKNLKQERFVNKELKHLFPECEW